MCRQGFDTGVTGVIALVLAAGGWYAAGAPLPAKMADYFDGKAAEVHAKPAEPEIWVKVATAETREVPIAFTYTGTIIAAADAMLQARDG